MKNTEIIAICNQKGGVTKTTTAVNLGTNLARKGKHVLLVDIDPQANLTMCMGFQNPDELHCTIANILDEYITEHITLRKEDYLLHSEGCDLIPSSLLLAGIEPLLVNAFSRETLLRQYLLTIQADYDYILIDCAPSLGVLTINALAAATSVLIPVQAHYLSAKGLELLIGTVARVKRQINRQLTFKGILVTMFDQRLNLSRAILSELESVYGDHIHIFETKIPQSIRAAENTVEGKSLHLYDPTCKVSLAYEAFSKEMM